MNSTARARSTRASAGSVSRLTVSFQSVTELGIVSRAESGRAGMSAEENHDKAWNGTHPFEGRSSFC